MVSLHRTAAVRVEEAPCVHQPEKHQSLHGSPPLRCVRRRQLRMLTQDAAG